MRVRGGELEVESTSGHGGLRKRPLFPFSVDGGGGGWGGLITERHSV